jgi:hypothetical protein
MKSSRPRGLSLDAVFLALLATVALATQSCGSTPIKPLVDRPALLPIAGQLLGPHGDPKIVAIGVAWSGDGYCPDQLQVSAVEASTTVTVSDIVVVSGGGGSCAGVRVINHTAWAFLRLKSPLGARQLVRKRDGAVLPVFGS